MTIHAYSELYLNDAMINLGCAFDYAINDCEINPETFSFYFSTSPITEQFEKGNPAYIAGMSGIELAMRVIHQAEHQRELPEQVFKGYRTKEYWAGWALAQYQWFSARSFKTIFDHISLKEILSLYPIYHEMDITRFIEFMEERCNKLPIETKLHIRRKAFGFSQSELSKLSHVDLRSIQLYEQRVNDIDKAQAKTLFRLSRALKCNIEDLLENPESF